ncbi:MAG: rRNA maturation RNase YbeY, partial [Fimbriimonadaceae bacterium]|nr:rRNA maturation RNase YbeY [Alphaproteobacteria bacterium]
VMLIDICKVAGDWPGQSELGDHIRRAVAKTISVAGLPVHAQSELSIALSSDDEVKTLNRTYRNQDKATNVLSFAQFDELKVTASDGGKTGKAVPPGLIGDIVLAYETIAREADEAGIAFSDHLDHLVVHGLLHLYGYDHIEAGEADIMEKLEVRILAELGIPDPYRGPVRGQDGQAIPITGAPQSDG